MRRVTGAEDTPTPHRSIWFLLLSDPRARSRFIAIFLAVAALFAVRSLAGQTTAILEANVAEQYLLAAADQERSVLNLPPLRRDPALVAAARQHASLMVQHGAISHQFPGESDLSSRAAAAGARFSLISENVAESTSAAKIHQAWMNSEGHRHNLLDPNVDSVGIAVMAHGRQFFAVEDFERSVRALSLAQQESAVADLIANMGIQVDPATTDSRKLCAGSNFARSSDPADFLMRYTTANLNQLPEQLVSRLGSKRYAAAIVTACAPAPGEPFSMYRLAVLLYDHPTFVDR